MVSRTSSDWRVDALTAQGFGLDVTGQNIANSSTPGYVNGRRCWNRAPSAPPLMAVCRGRHRRSVDRFLDARANEAGSFSPRRSRVTARSHKSRASSTQRRQRVSGRSTRSSDRSAALATNPSDPTARAATLAAPTTSPPASPSSEQLLPSGRISSPRHKRRLASDGRRVADRQLNAKIFEPR